MSQRYTTRLVTASTNVVDSHYVFDAVTQTTHFQYRSFRSLTRPVQRRRGHHSYYSHPSVHTDPPRPGQSAFQIGSNHISPAPYSGPWFMPGDHYHLPFVPLDDVAFLDYHMDMPLDFGEMSYEELLALGQRIGNVRTGLTEEKITSQMKTKTYLEEAASKEEEPDSCRICLSEYENKEEIGILKCGHEYHVDCLKKWLLEKNVCPLCKSEAMNL